MTRLIPKSTKIRMQFYKGITLPDIMIGLVFLFFVALAASSNLPHRFLIALAILAFAAPLFAKIGDERLYFAVIHFVRYLAGQKHYRKSAHGKQDLHAVVPFMGIDNGLIRYPGYAAAVIEIKPMEFRLLFEQSQDRLIEAFADAIRCVGNGQSMDITKLEQPMILDAYLTDDLGRIGKIVQYTECGTMRRRKCAAARKSSRRAWSVSTKSIPPTGCAYHIIIYRYMTAT